MKKSGFSLVFQRKRYVVLSIVIALLIFSFILIGKNGKTLFQTLLEHNFLFFLSFFKNLLIGGMNSTTTVSLIVLIIVALLTGIMISMLSFKITNLRSAKHGTVSIVGAILGVSLPGCASCGIGLLSLLGLGSLAAYLPFKGLELGVLSIGLLLFSIYKISNDITQCKTCQVPVRGNHGRSHHR